MSRGGPSRRFPAHLKASHKRTLPTTCDVLPESGGPQTACLMFGKRRFRSLTAVAREAVQTPGPGRRHAH